jgi:DNA-binding response OmpR family regulator
VTGKPLILAVDSNRANLEVLSQELGREGYATLKAASLEELDGAIKGKERVALSLIDLSGFDERIWERCEELREAKIPFILLSPQRSPTVQRDSLKYGASGLLLKPLAIQELLEHIRTMIGD